MNDYVVEIKRSARKELENLPDEIFRRIDKGIISLSKNPRPSDCKKLSGMKNLWRIRTGDYRIVYSIDDKNKFVMIIRIGHRKDIYD